MTIHRTRDGAVAYGQAIGIILLDCVEPFIPGDVGNASTYPFPVLYHAVPGLTTEAAFAGEPGLTDAVVEASQALERQGVKAVTSNCGFLLHYQEAVREAVRVPVFMSSLLQLPLIARSLGSDRAIGVITANARSLGNELVVRAGLDSRTPIHVVGLEESPEFKASMLDFAGVLDAARLEAETVEVARELTRRHPDMGAILLECAVLPPYAHAVQAATGLPVFDFITMIDYLFAGTHRRAYAGHY